MIRKILMTGVTGFLGSHIANRLVHDGYEVCAIIRNGSDITAYRLSDGIRYLRYDGTLDSLVEGMLTEKPDCVIHLAAKFVAEHHREQVDMLLDSNIVLSAHLFEAMRISDCRYLLNTTSSWEHYAGEEYNPVCLYAATKRAVTDLLKYYCEAEGMRAITLSIYDTYGLEDHRGKLISKLFEIGQSGEHLAMSEGYQTVNYVYIDDVVEAYLSALRILTTMQESMKSYEVRSEEVYTLRELSELFEKVTGLHLMIDWGKRPYRKREVMHVYEGGQVLPDWKPAVSLDAGLRLLLEQQEGKTDKGSGSGRRNGSKD